jgi:hypothetical protein
MQKKFKKFMSANGEYWDYEKKSSNHSDWDDYCTFREGFTLPNVRAVELTTALKNEIEKLKADYDWDIRELIKEIDRLNKKIMEIE